MSLLSQPQYETGEQENLTCSGKRVEVWRYLQAELYATQKSLNHLVTGIVVSVVAMLVVLAVSNFAWAHKVKVFAYVEGDTVFVEGYFGAGAKAMNSPVAIYDAGENKIIEGKTDSKGTCTFKVADLPPFDGDLKVVLTTGDGHKAEYTLSADELPGKAPAKPGTKAASPTRDTKAATQQKSSQQAPTVQEDTLTQVKLIEEVLDRKLKPIIRALGSQQKLLLQQQDKEPSFRDIIGGIGWIVGIVGLLAYFMSRRRDS
jgi:nickel transport protein